jgi:hypothetical protein
MTHVRGCSTLSVMVSSTAPLSSLSLGSIVEMLEQETHEFHAQIKVIFGAEGQSTRIREDVVEELGRQPFEVG